MCVHNKITGTPKPKNQSDEDGTYALDVTKIEKLVCVLLRCTFIPAYLCDVYLCSFGRKLQLYWDELGWPFRLHRKAGEGANGAYQVLDDKNPVLYHVHVTFSLEICNALMSGDIIPGLNIDTKKFLVSYPSYQEDHYPAYQEDDADEEHDDDDEHNNDNDVDSPPAAGFSTSPSI